MEKKISKKQGKQNPSFESFLAANWPKEIPTDCTKVIRGFDCIERGIVSCCASCEMYQILAGEFPSDRPALFISSRKPKIQNEKEN